MRIAIETILKVSAIVSLILFGSASCLVDSIYTRCCAVMECHLSRELVWSKNATDPGVTFRETPTDRCAARLVVIHNGSPQPQHFHVLRATKELKVDRILVGQEDPSVDSIPDAESAGPNGCIRDDELAIDAFHIGGRSHGVLLFWSGESRASSGRAAPRTVIGRGGSPVRDGFFVSYPEFFLYVAMAVCTLLLLREAVAKAMGPKASDVPDDH